MKKKQINAWAILGTRNRPVAIEVGAKRPHSYSIGTWGFMLSEDDKSAVPCTITYSLPTPSKTTRKKKK
jgi:hypothetical protein